MIVIVNFCNYYLEFFSNFSLLASLHKISSTKDTPASCSPSPLLLGDPATAVWTLLGVLMSHDDIRNDIMEAEDSLPSSAETDLADHSRVVGGILVEQLVSGNLPFPDYRYTYQH